MSEAGIRETLIAALCRDFAQGRFFTRGWAWGCSAWTA